MRALEIKYKQALIREALLIKDLCEIRKAQGEQRNALVEGAIIRAKERMHETE